MTEPTTASETTQVDFTALRNLALSQPEDAGARLLGVAICAALLISVLYLVHRGKLREEYTPIWVVASVSMMLVLGSFDLLRLLTQAVGAWTPSSALFFFGLLFLLVLSLNYAVRLSGMSLQLKLLAQEIALLRAQAPDKPGSASAREDGGSRKHEEEVHSEPGKTPEREP